MPTIELDPADRTLIVSARRAVLATIGPRGRPRLVPIVFAIDEAPRALVVYSPLDDKPKSVADVRDLARVRDIARDARAALLVDHWNEDWSQLAWVGLEGTASLIERDEPSAAEHERAAGLLRARYPQYREGDLARRPMLRIEVDRVRRWSAKP